MYFQGVENGQVRWSVSRAQEVRAYCLGGIRSEGGVSLVQATVRNVGTSHVDAKGEAQAGSPREGQSTEAASRDGVARSSGEARESAWSEGVTSSSCNRRSTRLGRSLWA
jgi:hypothetical protein